MKPHSTISRESWIRVCERLRTKYSALTEADLILIDGREDDLLDTIVRKIGRTREAVIDVFSALGMFTGHNRAMLMAAATVGDET